MVDCCVSHALSLWICKCIKQVPRDVFNYHFERIEIKFCTWSAPPNFVLLRQSWVCPRRVFIWAGHKIIRRDWWRLTGQNVNFCHLEFLSVFQLFCRICTCVLRSHRQQGGNFCVYCSWFPKWPGNSSFGFFQQFSGFAVSMIRVVQRSWFMKRVWRR